MWTWAFWGTATVAPYFVPLCSLTVKWSLCRSPAASQPAVSAAFMPVYLSTSVGLLYHFRRLIPSRYLAFKDFTAKEPGSCSPSQLWLDHTTVADTDLICAHLILRKKGQIDSTCTFTQFMHINLYKDPSAWDDRFHCKSFKSLQNVGWH